MAVICQRVPAKWSLAVPILGHSSAGLCGPAQWLAVALVNRMASRHPKILSTFASSGAYLLLNVSGYGSSLGNTSADNYKWCYTYVAGQCHGGSAVGDVYVNLPIAPYYKYCYEPNGTGATPIAGQTDICIGDASSMVDESRQFVATGDTTGAYMRNLGTTNVPIGYWDVFANHDTVPGESMCRARTERRQRRGCRCGHWDGWQTLTGAPTANSFTFASSTRGSASAGNVGVLVGDVTPALFSNPNLDSRSGNVANDGTGHGTFVIGKRDGETALDAFTHARAGGLYKRRAMQHQDLRTLWRNCSLEMGPQSSGSRVYTEPMQVAAVRWSMRPGQAHRPEPAGW